MLGVIVNTLAVAAGGGIGLLLKKGVKQKYADAIMAALDLCVLALGVSGLGACDNVAALVLSMVLGAAAGTALNIEGGIERLGARLEAALSHGGGDIAKGFVTAGLISCTGAFAIMGSLNAGLGDNQMLYTKALMDFIVCMMLASSLGVGVVLSAGMIFVYQGAIALCAGFLAPLLSQDAIAALGSTGSLLIVALGLNMLGITKLKVGNMIPAVLLAPLVVGAMGALGM